MSLKRFLLGSVLTLAIGILPVAAQDASSTTSTTTTTTQTTDHNDTNSKTKKAVKKAASKTKDAAEATGEATKDAATAAGHKMSGNSHKVDLNTASKEELDALPGIGDEYSQKIIDNRPYASKRELVTKNVLPQATYDKVKNDVVAKRSGSASASSDTASAKTTKTKKTTTTTTTSSTDKQ